MTMPGGNGGRTDPKIGLALAGGGPAGAIYEIGALRALDEAIDGIDFNNLHVYVGVSAGAFICSNLANDISPKQMCRAIVKHEPGEHPFVPETFYAVATGELLRRTAAVPGLLGQGIWSFLKDPLDKGLFGSLMLMGRALPTGLFDNRHLGEYLARIFSLKNRTNDFRQLEKNLIIVAADLDSGQAVRFGQDGHEHVPISKAVEASTALPGVYAPVEIEGRHYVDGVLLKTMHGSVALEEGAELLICLNPLVPVDTAEAVSEGVMRRGKLIDRGLPTVLSQSLRTMIRSRLGAGLAAYDGKFPSAEVVLFEPPADDYDMFFTNVFSFSSRRMVCEHAYESTRTQLLERYDELAPILARHGLTLRQDVLEDADRDLWDGVGLGRYEHRPGVLNDLDSLLNRLEDYLDEAG
jgi:predicted acylesterase/phospholipase RssA